MNLKEEIINYIPFNQQEQNDKQLFIIFLENNSNCFERINDKGHVTTSCWILNQKHDKVLMAYHNIYESFGWLGGHNDGDFNCINVGNKELQEESGLTSYKLLSNNIFSIEILKVKSHYKNKELIKEHLHYNVTYLYECDENDQLTINELENQSLKWIKIKELKKYVKEHNMYQNVYKKLNEKVEELYK